MPLLKDLKIRSYSWYHTFTLLEIQVHLGHCYLWAKHGHEVCEGKHFKDWSIVSHISFPCILNFNVFGLANYQTYLWFVNAEEIYLYGFWYITDLRSNSPLRKFARKKFCENFIIERWWVSDVRNVKKKWGVTDFVLERTCPWTEILNFF